MIPCRAILGERATDAVCEPFIQRYGLDKAILPGLFREDHVLVFRLEDVPPTFLDNQFTKYLGGLAQGDLGDSIKFSRPVAELLIERLPTTLELTFFALLIAVIVGVPLGLISGYRHNSSVDVGTMGLANLGVSIPVFVLGLVLAYVFAVVLKDTPFSLPPSGRLSSGIAVIPLVEVWGMEDLQGPFRVLLDFVSGLYVLTTLITGQWEAFVDAGRHLILPAIALATIPLAIIARITRSSLLEVLGQDYVRTARAKGLDERSVVLRHATRNALLPVITVDRTPARRAARRSGADRDRVQSRRRRPQRVRGDHGPRLHGHPGVHARHRVHLRRGEPVRRHLVHVPRPTREDAMSATDTSAPLAVADEEDVDRPKGLLRDTLGNIRRQRSAVDRRDRS